MTATLCADCGLCCDGTLFSSVSLGPSGAATARAHHLPVLEAGTESKLQMPCAALRGVLCAVYESRPETCADFSCALRTRVDQGRTSVAKAHLVIDATRLARDRVRDALDGSPWWTGHRAVTRAARDDPAWAKENASLVEDLKTVEQLVRRHFWT